MKKTRVFIASSKESFALVRVLKRELGEFAVVTWDEPGLMQPGHTFADELLRLSKSFDFALFLYRFDV